MVAGAVTLIILVVPLAAEAGHLLQPELAGALQVLLADMTLGRGGLVGLRLGIAGPEAGQAAAVVVVLLAMGLALMAAEVRLFGVAAAVVQGLKTPPPVPAPAAHQFMVGMVVLVHLMQTTPQQVRNPAVVAGAVKPETLAQVVMDESLLRCGKT
jgi:hypothetical protein